MPTYTIHYSALELSAEQKHQLAQRITQVHHGVTGADAYFAQVIFQEVSKEDCYLGGSPLEQSQLFMQGQIRAGRSSELKDRLLLALRDVLIESTGLESSLVWVYLIELRSSEMIEYGLVLPPAGKEKEWFLSLDKALQRKLAKKQQ